MSDHEAQGVIDLSQHFMEVNHVQHYRHGVVVKQEHVAQVHAWRRFVQDPEHGVRKWHEQQYKNEGEVEEVLEHVLYDNYKMSNGWYQLEEVQE